MRPLGMFLALWIASPGLAFGQGGVFEINQVCALRGCFPGDSAGFPVTLSSAGSYALTGSLDVPASTRGIEIVGDSVTFDLRGFSVAGNGGLVDADGIWIAAGDAEVRNGTVRGFTRHGIFADGSTADGHALGSRILDVRAIANETSGIAVTAPGSTVERCTAVANQFRGIDIGNNAVGSLLTHSVARANVSIGFRVFPSPGAAGWGYNVATENNGGNANPQAVLSSTAFELGPNVCGSDLVCP